VTLNVTEPNAEAAIVSDRRRPTRPSRPVPKPPEVIRRDGKIRFYLDDPSTGLTQEIDVPVENPDPLFVVQNYVGYTPEQNTPQTMAANCHAVLLSAQTMLRKYLGNPLPRWAATQSLHVIPQAGNQLNAFYDRLSFKFFSGKNPVTGEVVHTCLSADVVTHEWCHAVLDSMKPQLFNSPFVEQSAFHEGFSDCGSILHSMSLDPVLTLMAQQVDAGQTSTVVSSVAPDLGYAITKAMGGLRDASVPFHYAKPETLPRLAPRDQLSREVHSYSRVFSSAFYACIMAVAAKAKASTAGMNTKESLAVARDIMGHALFQAVKAVPVVPQFMSAVAESVLTAMTGSPYASDVATVFLTWGLSTVKAASAERTVIEPTDRKEKLGDLDVLIRDKHTRMILAGERVVSMDNNPLYFCQVEVPREEMLVAQTDGTAEVVLGATDDEIVDQVKLGLDYIWESDLVTLHGQPVKDRHVFKVDDAGLLTRTGYNNDNGYFNNATTPGAPEFGKPWKAENNSGCCAKGEKTEPPAKPPKLGCYVNERVCGSRTVRSCQVVRQKVC